jgi:CheY-like chemotaxis protein
MGSKRVLIVDDEESILIVLKNSLTKLGPGYQVTTVNSGLVALDQMVAQSFDLVVTDYSMAQMDGLELLAAIRYVQPDIPVIMMTAYATDALEQEAHRLRIYRYLTKPLDINVFRRVVQEALGDETVSRHDTFAISDDSRHQINRLRS